MLLEEACQYTKRHDFLYPKEEESLCDSEYADMLISGTNANTGSYLRRRSCTPEVEESEVSGPDKKKMKLIERNRKIVAKNKKKYLDFLTGRYPFISVVKKDVPQKTSCARLTMFSGTLVVCLLSKVRTVIGRKGSRDENVDLDMKTLGVESNAVSHRHCVVVWDNPSRIFLLQSLSENPFLVDGKEVLRGDFVPLHNGSKIVIHRLTMELEIPSKFTLPLSS